MDGTDRQSMELFGFTKNMFYDEPQLRKQTD
jgi:hypothetical protein